MSEPVEILIGMCLVFGCGWYLRGILNPATTTVTRWITEDQRRGANGRFQKLV